MSGRLLFEVTGSHNSVDSDQRRQPGVGFDIISAYDTTTGTMFRAISAVAVPGTSLWTSRQQRLPIESQRFLCHRFSFAESRPAARSRLFVVQ